MARHFDLQSWLISKIWQDLVTLSPRNPGQAASSPPFEHDIECQCKCQGEEEGAKVDDDDKEINQIQSRKGCQEKDSHE